MSKLNHEEICTRLRNREYGNDIAKELQVDRNSIIYIAKKYGVSYNPKHQMKYVTDEILVEMRRLGRRGYTCTEITEKTGFSYCTVHKHLKPYFSEMVNPPRIRRNNPPQGQRRKERISIVINNCLDALGSRISHRDRKFLREVAIEKIFSYDNRAHSFEALGFASIFLSSVCLMDTPPLRKHEVQRLTSYSLHRYCCILRDAGLYPNVCKLTPEMVLYIKRGIAFKRLSKWGYKQYHDDYPSVFDRVYKNAVKLANDKNIKQGLMGRSPYTIAAAFLFYSFKYITGEPIYGWQGSAQSIFQSASVAVRRIMNDIDVIVRVNYHTSTQTSTTE